MSLPLTSTNDCLLWKYMDIAEKESDIPLNNNYFYSGII